MTDTTEHYVRNLLPLIKRWWRTKIGSKAEAEALDALILRLDMLKIAFAKDKPSAT